MVRLRRVMVNYHSLDSFAGTTISVGADSMAQERSTSSRSEFFLLIRVARALRGSGKVGRLGNGKLVFPLGSEKSASPEFPR